MSSDQASAPTPTNATTASITTAKPATASTATAAVLTVPGTTKGEVSRTTLLVSGTDTPANTSIIADPVKGRSYVVRSACTASGAPTATITYRLVDARAASANRTPEKRTVMSSQTPCDGQPHMDWVGSLAFPVTVEYDGTASGVDAAYTIVAPA